MHTEQWIEHFKKAFKFSGKTFTNEDKAFLLQNYIKSDEKLQEKMLEISNIMMKLFFKTATNGETFGLLSEAEMDLGKTVEEIYGLSEGPFLNFAKTYCTFRYQVDIFSQEHHRKNLLQILRYVEMLVETNFFPPSGSKRMSRGQHSMRQESILNEYAPSMDIKRFLSENPISKGGSKRGCFGAIISFSFIIIIVVLIFI